jgi:FtsP/CotA-like multicopper oxidase with cupredoxin domain
MRVPNAMDGVPHLTQQPIAPGGRFAYEFDAVDAGTFWYHPHQRSFEQVGRGLYGALIVEEAEPPEVDRDLVWVLDDWRPTEEAEIAGDFGGFHDKSHAGRLGNTVTINGHVPNALAVRSGERIRLRLINAANARIFALDFGALVPKVIALDGQPVAPHAPGWRGWVLIGPAMRVDLILDLTGAPGERVTISDRFLAQKNFALVDLAYADDPLRDAPPDWLIALPANPLPEPDLRAARRHEVAFTGGMMGGMVERQMGLAGDDAGMGGMMGRIHDRGIWFVNGIAAEGHILDPMLTLERDASHVIAMTNATAFHHPIHWHGHSFRVLSRNGQPTAHRELQDTVLMAPRERVEIAFVADNPGDWIFHCHILEHQASGMMGVIRVA